MNSDKQKLISFIQDADEKQIQAFLNTLDIQQDKFETYPFIVLSSHHDLTIYEWDDSNRKFKELRNYDLSMFDIKDVADVIQIPNTDSFYLLDNYRKIVRFDRSSENPEIIGPSKYIDAERLIHLEFVDSEGNLFVSAEHVITKIPSDGNRKETRTSFTIHRIFELRNDQFMVIPYDRDGFIIYSCKTLELLKDIDISTYFGYTFKLSENSFLTNTVENSHPQVLYWKYEDNGGYKEISVLEIPRVEYVLYPNLIVTQDPDDENYLNIYKFSQIPVLLCKIEQDKKDYVEDVSHQISDSFMNYAGEVYELGKYSCEKIQKLSLKHITRGFRSSKKEIRRLSKIISPILNISQDLGNVIANYSAALVDLPRKYERLE